MKLSNMDKTILDSYAAMLDGLANYMGAGYELVLHSLEDLDHSVIKIINGHYSNRQTGAPVTDLALSMLKEIENNNEKQWYKTYFNRNKRGILTKSSTIPILGEKRRVIGLLCINFYMDTSFTNIIENFIPKNIGTGPEEENFVMNTRELIVNSLKDVKHLIHDDTSIQNVNKNKEILFVLYKKGIFNLKDAVVTVAEALGISKNTIYMHIRNFENQVSSGKPGA
jgi:predicted transcriptional regulator YheO